MKYIIRKEYLSTVTTFSRLSVFLTLSLIILFKFLFSPGLKFGMGPQKRINFPILSKAFQNYAPLVPFQNKSPKYELNIWVDSFWAHVPPPPCWKVCMVVVCVCGGGGEFVFGPLMI